MTASILLVFLQPTLVLPAGQTIDCWFWNSTHLFIQPVVETCTGYPVCLLSGTNKWQKIQRLPPTGFFYRSKVRVPEFNSNFEKALSEMEFNHHIGNRPATFYRSSLWLSCEQTQCRFLTFWPWEQDSKSCFFFCPPEHFLPFLFSLSLYVFGNL